MAAVAAATEAEADEEEVSLCVIMTNTEIFHIFHLQKKIKLNSEKTWKIWKKIKLNSEKTWKLWKKAK
jgi:hypothetical protein